MTDLGTPLKGLCRVSLCAVATLSVLVSGVPAAEENARRANNEAVCLAELEKRYGAVEFGEVLQKRSRGKARVRVRATTEAGEKIFFRCTVSYGELRGVDSYDGASWDTAKPAPVDPAEEETAVVSAQPEGGESGTQPEGGGEGLAEPEPNAVPEPGEQDGGTDAVAEPETGEQDGADTETQAEGTPEPEEAGETAEAGDGTYVMPLAVPKRYTVPQ